MFAQLMIYPAGAAILAGATDEQTTMGRKTLANVTVTTASAAGALSISGLDQATARRLVDDLTRQADAVEGDAT